MESHTPSDSTASASVSRLSPWVLLRSANRHPFIYKRMVREADPAARPGDVVHVYDKAGSLFGRAIYNPRSQIALRMLTHEDVPVDDAFWQSLIDRAVELRNRLRLTDTTDAYRLIHAEGDGLSGLIVERYADVLAFEFFALGMYQRRMMLAEMLQKAMGTPTSLDRPGRASPHWRVVFRADQPIAEIEGFKVELQSPMTDRIVIRENGIRYRVDVFGGHKTGFFCDQRENRKRFGELCKDADVLDVCCYTGGFGLSAKILGEAREVTGVDLDESALTIAKENVNLNNARVNLVHSDAFTYLRQMKSNGRYYDAVVMDPPKLVAAREEFDDGLRKYHDLNAVAMHVVRSGGLFLTCSCSGLVSPDDFRQVVVRAARSARRTLQFLAETAAGSDHPVMVNCPESAYLKALWFRLF